ncbi:isoaspartyl peptidase/L-asparaginase-like [Amphiura filiformis]|uniref:isoaspartyl peptidase/L-asparaginase-like n=1 Tax=Amphiura filiformis TaxID=82378 RepID=UPI003B21C71D
MAAQEKVIPTIIVHGGAGNMRKHEQVLAEYLKGIKIAVKAGYQALCGGTGSALNAVEAAVSSMEDFHIFNTGRGSNLTVDGEIEMDGFIMEGKEFRTGAVTCVQHITNPVQLARMVMEKTDHICLAGPGANKFAKLMGVPEVSTESLIVERRRKMLEEKRSFNPDTYDTVGAVAIDADGNIACAMSTGGITAQMEGRVGDAPLIGCGGYCDNDYGGVSTTGDGEAIAKVTLARNIIFYMEQGLSAQAAAEKGLHYMENKIQSHPAQGGVIVLDKYGHIGMYMTTQGMSWAYIQKDQLHYGLLKGEEFVEKTDDSM